MSHFIRIGENYCSMRAFQHSSTVYKFMGFNSSLISDGIIIHITEGLV